MNKIKEEEIQEVKMTANEWAEEFKVTFMDPKGFDSDRLDDKQMGEEEFRSKMQRSTIRVKWDSPLRPELQN